MGEWDYMLVEAEHGTVQTLPLDVCIWILRAVGPGKFFLAREPKGKPEAVEWVDLNWDNPDDA